MSENLYYRSDGKHSHIPFDNHDAVHLHITCI